MHRRTLLLAGLAGLGASRAFAQSMSASQLPPAQPRDPADRSGVLDRPEPITDPDAPPPGAGYRDAPPEPEEAGPDDMPGASHEPSYPTGGEPPRGPRRAETYSRDELVNSVSDFLGVTAESAGGAVERIFSQNQDRRPTGYIAGEEGAAAIFAGVRYGRGLLYMKGREPMEVFWQGPSIGWDLGGNASRVFTLCYDLEYPETIFQRFPGVEGSAYVVGGLGVNYQRAAGVTLAPIRAGVGFRLGANVGYLSYTRSRNPFPF